MFVFYVRYKQIATYQRDRPNKAVSRVNTAAFVMGSLAAFGISVVGNFQVKPILNAFEDVTYKDMFKFHFLPLNTKITETIY